MSTQKKDITVSTKILTTLYSTPDESNPCLCL